MKTHRKYNKKERIKIYRLAREIHLLDKEKGIGGLSHD